MKHWPWIAAVLAATLMLPGPPPARADRVPSSKAITLPSPGARGDITVPYTTNGRTALGVYDGVSPRILTTPVLSEPANPLVQPVHNFVYYGARMGFSSGYNGATPRPPQTLRPR